MFTDNNNNKSSSSSLLINLNHLGSLRFDEKDSHGHWMKQQQEQKLAKQKQKIEMSASLKTTTTTSLIFSHMKPFTIAHSYYYYYSLVLLVMMISLHQVAFHSDAISIKPADFERLIMPCYLGPSASSMSGQMSYLSSSQQQQQQQQIQPTSYTQQLPIMSSSSSYSSSGAAAQYGGGGGRAGLSSSNGQPLGSNNNNNNLNVPSYFGAPNNLPDSITYSSGGGGGGAYSSSSSSSAASYRDSLSPNLGQQIPRANTVENFIALVSKIEQANPRLAQNVDQLIRMLLGRFHIDNFYYDVRSKTSNSDQDHRADILPALFASQQQQQQSSSGYLFGGADSFPEHLLDHGEKCSMYFMLSHFIDKSTPLNYPLANTPVQQLAGPLNGQKPPYLQAAGAPYPGQSANSAFGGGGGASAGNRYPGPSPGFSSPLTNNMNGFGSGISGQQDYTGSNAYGQNVAQPNPQVFGNQNYNNMRQSGAYSGTLSSNSRFSVPYIDGQGRSRDEKMALEYGVVTLQGQENAALVLNRVLLGLLAAVTPAQSIRQLGSLVYPIQSFAITPRIDEEIDPLFAVTLADLWAISAVTKNGKPFDVRLMGDNGRWNDTMCPTSFQLERSSSIRFTTAELLGGLDGFSLGMFRRRLASMNRNIRLSEMLRMYYSRQGFRPQFAEVGVCNRAQAINGQLDDLRRQAENYLRLYELNLPTTDNEIGFSIQRLDSFKDFIRQAATQLSPQETCNNQAQDGGAMDSGYPMSSQDQCELAKVDLSIVMDTSPQANDVFQNLVVAKLAQRLGLSRSGNSLSVLTNQQDQSGGGSGSYLSGGGYNFNAILRNSTNTAEIGCALMHDTSRTYQGGQITDPTRLVEMFERALVNLDSEYLVRQQQNTQLSSSNSYASSDSSSYRSSNQPSSYVSSLFTYGAGDGYSYVNNGLMPKSTGGSKVIVWFNYGQMPRMSSLSSSPTNWQPPLVGGAGSSSFQSDQYQYKFQEAKKYLRENFRGASILAVASSREDAKPFVYDEARDIFTDIPQGNSVSPSSDYYSSSSSGGSSNGMDAGTVSMLNGPADQLVTKLLERMCDIPAVFQYPTCFRGPSENAMSVGYITPGRRQYWMMSPKTFFASKTVRVVFKVEGGRLRVCFGRMRNPEESANQYNQQYGTQSGAIALTGGGSGSPYSTNNNNQQQQQQQPITSDSNNYYTGLNNGVCKDVAQNQEIDFIVEDPCYKKPIAECEPFYFVIKETSNPGEGDPNYMCRDEPCKRLDQARFTMTHTGVTCSSAFKSVKANWLLIMISVLVTLGVSSTTTTTSASGASYKKKRLNPRSLLGLPFMGIILPVIVSLYFIVQSVQAQQAAPHDFGAGRYGERRGNFTPSEVVGIILLIMTILAGLALTVGLCYYVKRQDRRKMTAVEQDDY